MNVDHDHHWLVKHLEKKRERESVRDTEVK